MGNIFSFLVSSRFDVKSSLKNRKYYDEISNSGLFDEEFYKNTYDDVSGDALTHYFIKGHREGKLPSLDFDPYFYLKTYPSKLKGFHKIRILKID